MAVTPNWYGKAPSHLIKGEIAYLTDTIKVALVTAAYTYDKDVHETFADIVANEVAVVANNGYTARGVALGTKTVTYDTATDRSRMFAANPVWTPSSGISLAAAGAVFYKDTGTNATSYLLGHVNFGATITATGAPLTVNFDPTDGLLYIQVP